MASIQQLKEYFERVYFYVTNLAQEYLKTALIDVIMFCIYTMAADGKLTANEIKLFSSFLGKKANPEGIKKIIKAIDWSEYEQTVPTILKLMIVSDERDGLSFKDEDSKARNLLKALKSLGIALAEADGKDESEIQRVNNYILSQENFAMRKLDEDDSKTKKVNDKKSEHAKHKSQPPPQGDKVKLNAQSHTQARQETVNPQDGSTSGNWIPMEKHEPTGDFLDDVFRNSALTHEDRVQIWMQITSKSLPCVMIDNLDFGRAMAWYGSSDGEEIDFEEAYDEYGIKDNKPVYYYTSGIMAYLPEDESYISAGFAVHHQGIFLNWEMGNFYFPWDDLRLEMELEHDQGYKVIEIGCGMKLAFDNQFNPQELKNLLKVMNTRLEQIKPFRGELFVVEDFGWYKIIDDNDANLLCDKYLKSKNSKLDHTGKSKPSKQDKPAKQAEKKAEATKPKAMIQASKKGTGAVTVPSSGSTTKLDFWQAFKPYIDQMRHTEFSKVKIKDDDCLDAKPTVIVGVYNSILMRVSKKLLRLELYIDTETEAGNLQILDYIKAKIQIPPALKGRIEYERKEGRRAQRVCVSFPDFELNDRSCWGKYISEILSVADDFFDAVEVPMRGLIK